MYEKWSVCSFLPLWLNIPLVNSDAECMNELLIPFDDVQWEILLTEIQARRVIPIIGPELLRVTDPETGSEMTLDEYLARQLADWVLLMIRWW